jgi:hypothetical protein
LSLAAQSLSEFLGRFGGAHPRPLRFSNAESDGPLTGAVSAKPSNPFRQHSPIPFSS